ncbi:hypothetical protein EVAR_28793_1 [Eumeta japonica]|uniref:Uncharacterized protein n=1 Tax=Eumeta variegata TaxID=151549 RepID=A0A4C1VFZ5_EUMVA|nr:hypothetical protein EVAR_28793_1 [Eumeta japonica]
MQTVTSTGDIASAFKEYAQIGHVTPHTRTRPYVGGSSTKHLASSRVRNIVMRVPLRKLAAPGPVTSPKFGLRGDNLNLI